MAGYGLKKVLEDVYASNSVTHMLSGNSLSRAVWGHLLLDAALNTILIANAYNVPVPTKDELDEQPEADEAEIANYCKTSLFIAEPDLREARTEL